MKITTVNKFEILYELDNVRVKVFKSPKLVFEVGKLTDQDIGSLIRLLNVIKSDLGIEDVICISMLDSLSNAINVIPVLEHTFKGKFIYYINIDDIVEFYAYKNFIIESSLPIILNVNIPASLTKLDELLMGLKEYEEYTYLNENVNSLFKKYNRRLNRVTLTKHLEYLVFDSPYDKASFMFYLDRYKFKVDFSGDNSLVEEWKSSIEEYYKKKYFKQPNRRLKVKVV